jgi:hypothetical protein
MGGVVMFLECTCADITQARWDELMKGAKPCSYKRLVSRIKKQMPELYKALDLHLLNPWHEQAAATKTHWILVWSATEYFIKK